VILFLVSHIFNSYQPVVWRPLRRVPRCWADCVPKGYMWGEGPTREAKGQWASEKCRPVFRWKVSAAQGEGERRPQGSVAGCVGACRSRGTGARVGSTPPTARPPAQPPAPLRLPQEGTLMAEGVRSAPNCSRFGAEGLAALIMCRQARTER